jgi:hypothetical protein
MALEAGTRGRGAERVDGDGDGRGHDDDRLHSESGAFFFLFLLVVLFGRRSLVSRVPLGWPTCHGGESRLAHGATTKVQPPVKPHIAFRFILVLKNLLSYGGRLVLISFVFSSLFVTYMLSFYSTE